MDQDGQPTYNPNYGNYSQYGNQGGPQYGGAMDRNYSELFWYRLNDSSSKYESEEMRYYSFRAFLRAYILSITTQKQIYIPLFY